MFLIISVCALQCLWRPRGNFWGDDSFLCVGLGDRTQAARLAQVLLTAQKNNKSSFIVVLEFEARVCAC